jgi:hypothetical protein
MLKRDRDDEMDEDSILKHEFIQYSLTSARGDKTELLAVANPERFKNALFETSLYLNLNQSSRENAWKILQQIKSQQDGSPPVEVSVY